MAIPLPPYTRGSWPSFYQCHNYLERELLHQIGYGLTSILIHARALLAPQFVVATEPVPMVLAAMCTGSFMAIASNVRYQILQGIVEHFLPSISDALVGFGKVAVLLVRYANGVLGSWIAIEGIRAVGLHMLKRD